MKNLQTFLRLTRKVNLLLLAIVAMFCLWSPPAFAHRPHDVIDQIEISPDFETDRTLYILVRHNLYKSTDGGDNWTREIKGLDYTGELSSLSMSPSDKNTLYLASRADGIYKSTDAGESWKKVNQGLETNFIEIVDSARTSSDIALAVGKEKGLYRTENGGKTWTNIFKTPTAITTLASAPKNPDLIIFGDKKGHLYLSKDGGKNWENITIPKESASIGSIEFSPEVETDRTFYVGTIGDGIFQTVDLGKSFEPIGRGIEDKAIEDVVVSPNYATDSTLYVSTWKDGVYISRDGGKNWTKQNQGLTRDHQADDFKVPHFTELRVLKDRMYLAGFNGLFETNDGGQQWREIPTLLKGTIMAMAVSPNYANDSTLAVATYVGNIFLSRDKGQTWIPVNHGLEKYRFDPDMEEAQQDPRRYFDIAFSPDYGKDKTIFAGLLWSTLVKTDNGGDSWTIVPLPQTVRGITIAPSPNFAVDRAVYLTNQSGKIFRSTDGGNHFTYINDIGKIVGNGPPSIVISPDFANDRTIFATGNGGILRYTTTPSGASWQNTTEGTPLERAAFIQLAISPDYKNDGTVFASSLGGLYATRDRGKTWTRIENTPFPADSLIEAVAVSPDYATDKTVIVSLQGLGLFRSTDGGKTFGPIGDPSLPIVKTKAIPNAGIPIHFSPNYAQDKTLFGFGGAKTDIFRSTDGGKTWETFTVPPNVEEVTTRYRIGEFFSGHLGRLWRFAIPALAGLAAYFLAGFLQLEKKLAINKLVLGVVSAFVVFLIAFGLIAQF